MDWLQIREKEESKCILLKQRRKASQGLNQGLKDKLFNQLDGAPKNGKKGEPRARKQVFHRKNIISISKEMLTMVYIHRLGEGGGEGKQKAMSPSQKGRYQILRSFRCYYKKQVDSTCRQRRVTKYCKAWGRPNPFYVLIKTELVGTKLEQSRKKLNFIRNKNEESLAQGSRINEKVKRWKKCFRLTKSQSTSFYHERYAGKQQNRPSTVIHQGKKKDVCTNVLFAYPFSKSKQSE